MPPPEDRLRAPRLEQGEGRGSPPAPPHRTGAGQRRSDRLPVGHFPIHFMSRSTETSRIWTILPPLTMTSRARLVGRWSSLVNENGGVMPHVSKSFRLS